MALGKIERYYKRGTIQMLSLNRIKIGLFDDIQFGISFKRYPVLLEYLPHCFVKMYYGMGCRKHFSVNTSEYQKQNI